VSRRGPTAGRSPPGRRAQAARAPARAAAGKSAASSPAELARQYQTVALVLQGGGALGAYQCGVYEALHEAGIRPGWFAGTSIGAINAAILAGNPPERRVERLREFWDTICRPAGGLPWPLDAAGDWLPAGDHVSAWLDVLGAFGALAHGQQGFFAPRRWPPFLFDDGSPQATSFYDTTPLRGTLERLVDFDRIAAGGVRLSVGATQVETGNVRYFDSARERIRPEHVLASGALPPGFAAVPVDGEPYWDGGLVSNTPLEYVLESVPRSDTLVLQVDLWSARGAAPRTLFDVLERQKDIQFSSRTRMGTDQVAARQRLRNALGQLLERLDGEVPPALRAELEPWLCDRVFNIVHLIYRAKPYEQPYKDYAFGRRAMRAHWSAGADDMRRSLGRPAFFEVPDRALGVVTHDIHRIRDHGSARAP